MSGPRIALIAPILAVAVAGGLWAVVVQTRTTADEPSARGSANRSRLDDLLDRQLAVPFSQETPLSEVVTHLARELKVRVVLDPAAMARRDVRPDDPIRLDLPGTVKLRTALPLLLDPLGLTYRYVEGDDLLILTDAKGTGDSIREVLDELRDLHRDVHELQDAVDDLYDAIDGLEDAPMVHKPKIARTPSPTRNDLERPQPRKPGRTG